MINLAQLARRCGLPLVENGRAIYVGHGELRIVVWHDRLALTGPRLPCERLVRDRLAGFVYSGAAGMTVEFPAERLRSVLSTLNGRAAR